MTAQPELPDGIVVRGVSSATDMHDIAAMESAVWGQDMTWLGDDLIARISTAPDQVAVRVAEVGGEVVSAGWLVFREGTEFASLWGGSTLPHWRRKGIYLALVAERARIAVERGVKFLQVDASDDSAPILGRLGFCAITMTTPYVWSLVPSH